MWTTQNKRKSDHVSDSVTLCQTNLTTTKQGNPGESCIYFNMDIFHFWIILSLIHSYLTVNMIESSMFFKVTFCVVCEEVSSGPEPRLVW